MFEPKSDLPLPAVKLALGQPDYLDYRGLNLVDAHRRLGKQVRPHLHGLVRRKFQEFTPAVVQERLRLARHCQLAVRQKLAQPGEAVQRAALAEYVTCLAAWGQGAGLAALGADQLREIRVDGQPVSGEDLAYLLQDDDVGCQTGLWRAADGSVCLSHSEEDREPLGARFDRLRLMAFTVTDQGRAVQVVSFIYPDLLPGPAFGWRSDNYVQAVDSLNLKPKAPASGILANIATWVTLRLGSRADLEETIAYLGPFADGYALNTLYREGERVVGRKVEFAGAYTHGHRLGEAPGSFLYQVNKFTDPNASVAQKYEAVAPDKRQRLQERLARAESWLLALPPDANATAALFQFLCSAEGGEYACANRDVKAYLIARSTRRQLQVSIGTGPALAGDPPEVFQFAP
jgi:hypothetical protein